MNPPAPLPRLTPLLARALHATSHLLGRLAARLIGAAHDEIALTTNTSYGLNLAARMLPLEPGDVVLTSDKEFPANVYPWWGLESRGVTTRVAAIERGRLTARGLARGTERRNG